MNPEEYFNSTFFTDYFKSKLRLKKGGALDGLTPDTFWKRYERELEVISKRCIEGTYKFSLYLEKLILKGKDKCSRQRDGQDDPYRLCACPRTPEAPPRC